MTDPERADRRRYRHEVELLLDRIGGHVRELRRLEAAGVRGRGLAARERELALDRGRLAAVVGHDLDGRREAA